MVECPICTITKKVCKKLGNGTYCDLLIKDLYADKVTVEQVITRLHEKFGDKIFTELGKELEEAKYGKKR